MGVILEFCLTEMGLLLGGRVICEESKKKKLEGKRNREKDRDRDTERRDME